MTVNSKCTRCVTAAMADCWDPKQSTLYYNAAMPLNRSEFVQVLAAGIAGGIVRPAEAADPYDLPRFGNVHLLHFTDCHAQLLPT